MKAKVRQPDRSGEGRMSDRAEIHEVTGRYARALDERNWDELAALFTADGTWGAIGLGEAVGGAAIVALIKDMERTLPPQFHIITNQVVELDGGHAALTAYIQVIRLPLELWAAGKYELDVVKQGGRWKIRRMLYIPVETLLAEAPAIA